MPVTSITHRYTMPASVVTRGSEKISSTSRLAGHMSRTYQQRSVSARGEGVVTRSMKRGGSMQHLYLSISPAQAGTNGNWAKFDLHLQFCAPAGGGRSAGRCRF